MFERSEFPQWDFTINENFKAEIHSLELLVLLFQDKMNINKIYGKYLFIPRYKTHHQKSAYIHPQAVIIGNVEIGEEVYIGP